MHYEIVFAKPVARVWSSSYSPMAAWVFLQISSLVTRSLSEMFNSLRKHLISKACVLFSNSAVNVHDLQTYRNMEMTRDAPASPLIQEIRCYLSSFIRAAVACAILERISSSEPSSETTAPKYLKLVTVPSFCQFTFISL